MCIVALVLAGWVTQLVLAQPPSKKPVEEEDAEQPKLKAPLRVDEEETPLSAELATEAEHASQPVIRALLLELAVPYDQVTWKDGRKGRAAPVSQYVGASPPATGTVNLRLLDDRGKPRPMSRLSVSEIQRIDHYEEWALNKVNEFLKTAGSDVNALTRLDRVTAGERALGAVTRFHESALASHTRDGSGWDQVQERLRRSLFALELEHLRLLADHDDWAKAVELVDRLGKLHGDQQTQEQLAQQLARMAESSYQQKNYPQARQRARVLEEQFPNAPAARSLEDQFQQRALALLNQARQKDEANDRPAAMQLLTLAEGLAPRLPGLRDYRLRLSNAYPTLLVGVHKLPEFFSPATAVADSEIQALELLFESLVKVHANSADAHESTGSGVERFEPELSSSNPEVIPMGRRFHLRRDAYWSNGDRVTAADVNRTAHLLKSTGHDPSWGELVEGPLPSADPFLASLRMHQGFLEPLSLMTFKILPASANLERLDDPDFARHPVGSGPFMLKPASEVGTVTFIANPSYHRSDQPGLPQIREIRFIHSENPAIDFQKGGLHLLLDLPTEALQAIKSLDNVTYKTFRNRRIYFLAVNHRLSALQDVRLRKAIGYGVDRELILNTVYRSFLRGGTEVPHRPLNGPFPPDCWAAMPDLKPDPCDPPLAKKFANEARNGAAAAIRLKLKYPDDDERTKLGCEAIRDQLAKAGIEIELVPRAPQALLRDVERDHDYELAYYHHDYADDRYWLWPLFNPRGVNGGGNYLGYTNDSELESDFQTAMVHREFAKVQQALRSIHGTIARKMPLIPLWQLDTHVALHKDLTIPWEDFDPLRVFSNVERWKLEKR
jgi:peptide/nickel transport system substrate-binding protein